MTTETKQAADNSQPQAQWIDWLAFCDRDSTRYALDAPWVQYGWKLATDSRSLVAVPTGEADSPPDAKGRRRPNPFSVLQPILDGRAVGIDWQPLPKFEICLACKNKGTVKETCDECRGSKQVECNYGHKHLCGDCDEFGKVNRNCYCFVTLGGRCIQGFYFEKVAALPDVKWYVPNSNNDSAVWFCFGEHQNCFAMVMPLSSEHDPEWTERKVVMV